MKIKVLFLFPILSVLLFLPPCRAQMVIGADSVSSTHAHSLAAVEIRSAKGVSVPRLTYAQRRLMAVDSLCAGLVVWQTDRKTGYYAFDGINWCSLQPVLPAGSDTLSAEAFAPVAFSGLYSDLINKPVISDGNTTANFAKVAYSGDYNDLVGRPTIPQSFPQLAAVAYTASAEDLKNVPSVPVHLEDLAQDDYYKTVSLQEKTEWNEAARTPVCRYLRDLPSTYTHQTATDKDIAFWDSAARRTLPVALRELAQDSLHRTMTAEEKSVWNNHAQKTIPSKVRDLETDDYHKPITLTQRNDFDRHAAAPIPTRLADLMDGWGAVFISDEEIARWDKSAAMGHFSGSYRDLRHRPVIHTALGELAQDSLHMTVPEADMKRWNDYAAEKPKTSVADYAGSISNSTGYYQLVSENDKSKWNDAAKKVSDTLSEAARHNDYALLRNIPDYADVVFSGNYADLKGTPAFAMDFIRSNRISDLKNVPSMDTMPRFWQTGSFNDLEGHPVYDKVAKSGKWGDLKNRPVKLSDLTADDLSVHITEEKMTEYDDIGDFYKGEGNYADTKKQGDVYINWKSNTTRLSSSLKFSGNPTISRLSMPADTSSQVGRNRVVTVGELKKLDAANIVATNTDPFPEGTVLMWDGAAYPSGWCEFWQMNGRFPVCVNSGLDNSVVVDNNLQQKYAIGDRGGEKEVTLSIEEMPSHNHIIKIDASRKGAASLNDPDDNYQNPTNYNELRYFSKFIRPAGAGEKHNNLPPYRALHFIIKSKKYCASSRN